jgi:hypothetical protein
MKIFKLFVPLTFACFALSPKMQAIGPEPNEADLIENIAEEDQADLTENMAEEDAAVLDLTAVAGYARINGKQKKPNQWKIRMDFTDYVMRAMEKVRFRGELHVKFVVGVQNGLKFATPREYLLTGLIAGKPFSALGTGPKPTLGRTYRLTNNKGQGRGIKHEADDFGGFGSCKQSFEFTAKSNLPGKQVQFRLEFPMSYEFNKNGKVIHLETRPEIIPRGLRG